MVAMAALRGKQTITALCQPHEVASSLVHKWKKQLIEHGEVVFQPSDSSTTVMHQEKEFAQLCGKIGQLTIERDFIKKVLGEYVYWRGKCLSKKRYQFKPSPAM